MSKEKLNIGGECFDVVRSRKYPCTVRSTVSCLSHGYSDIFTAYGKPSYWKQRIWEDWLHFAEVNGLMNMTILSRNCFKFTIGAIYIDPVDSNNQYFIYITDRRKEAYPIVSGH